jgi:hypothetical protein
VGSLFHSSASSGTPSRAQGLLLLRENVGSSGNNCCWVDNQCAFGDNRRISRGRNHRPRDETRSVSPEAHRT